MEDSFRPFQDVSPLSFRKRGIANEDIKIIVGKDYTSKSTKEVTEIDASIEAPGILIFIEAKLYSSLSPADPPKKPHDQIAKKLRVGLDSLTDGQAFFFVFLDIAPVDKMNRRKRKETVLAGTGCRYKDKWLSAWWFKYYKLGRNNSLRPLRDALEGIEAPPTQDVANNMSWLTWADLFKSTMRAVLAANTKR